MIGMKMTVAQNMMPSVRWLETASHTVRLAPGTVEEGITKGNIDTPAVPITPTMAKVEAATDQNNRDAQSLAAPYRILQLCSGVSDALRGRRTVSVLRHWEHGPHLRSGLIAQILIGLMSWTYRTLKRRRMLRP